MLSFWPAVGTLVAFGLAVLLATEWRAWRTARRDQDPLAYPTGRLLRRTLGIACLESVLVLLLLMDQSGLGASSPWLRLALTGIALILSLLALLLALRDIREARRAARIETLAMAAEAVGALREALKERGLDVRVEDRSQTGEDEDSDGSP